MAIEPKEWNLGTRRSVKEKSGGIHVYINSTTLERLGLKAGDLEYNQCALDNKKVLLKFRNKKSKHSKHLFNDGDPLKFREVKK